MPLRGPQGWRGDMEQRKILWIILSVGIFIALVLGVGLLWFYPKPSAVKAPEGAQVTEGEKFDAIEWVRKSEEYPGIESPKESPAQRGGDVVIVIGDSGSSMVQSKPIEAQSAVPQKTEVIKKPEPLPPQAVAKPQKTPVEAAPKPEKAKPKLVRVQEYWIQAGSYSNKFRAEEAKQQLAQKGLTGRVVSKLVNNQTYFRLRIGPYSDSKEAEKFLAWLKGVKGFEESYISIVYAEKEAD